MRISLKTSDDVIQQAIDIKESHSLELIKEVNDKVVCKIDMSKKRYGFAVQVKVSFVIYIGLMIQ